MQIVSRLPISPAQQQQHENILDALKKSVVLVCGEEEGRKGGGGGNHGKGLLTGPFLNSLTQTHSLTAV